MVEEPRQHEDGFEHETDDWDELIAASEALRPGRPAVVERPLRWISPWMVSMVAHGSLIAIAYAMFASLIFIDKPASRREDHRHAETAGDENPDTAPRPDTRAGQNHRCRPTDHLQAAGPAHGPDA